MKTVIITKWIDPYKLLETIKEEYIYQDYTFDGLSKDIEKKNFLKKLSSSKFSIGLYMKNVNKYYLFTRTEEFDIFSKLAETFGLKADDFEISGDVEKPFEMIDLGKAEAGVIIP